jgi:predicted MFS family arabinose efflux permease
LSDAAAVTAPASPSPSAIVSARQRRQVRWSLLFGNFVIGCGVMVVVGTLTDISRSLDVSVSVAGQLITVAAAVMCFGAPLLAGWVGGLDRRKLLAASLAWYAIGHALCALAPSYAALVPARALTVLGAAVFTPQAAAAIGAMTPPAERGGAITFIFLGWSIASVVGMPMSAWLGDAFGWQSAFFAIAALGAVAAVWVLLTVPANVRPATMTLAAWRSAFANPVLMAMVLVTALAGAGQFTLFSYIAPYFKTMIGASSNEVTLLFIWFGVFGVVGNALASRYVDRFGPDRAVAFSLVLMAVSLLAFPWATNGILAAVVLVPWALACFSTQSLQQARLGAAAPALAPALMALNSSAIYLGQAAGASSGGWLIDHGGYAPLNWLGLGWLALSIALSVWAGRQVGERRVPGRPA